MYLLHIHYPLLLNSLILIFCVPLNPNKIYRTFYQKCNKFIIVICIINFNYDVVNDRRSMSDNTSKLSTLEDLATNVFIVNSD